MNYSLIEKQDIRCEQGMKATFGSVGCFIVSIERLRIGALTGCVRIIVDKFSDIGNNSEVIEYLEEMTGGTIHWLPFPTNLVEPFLETATDLQPGGVVESDIDASSIRPTGKRCFFGFFTFNVMNVVVL
jgi:hypothetical protein